MGISFTDKGNKSQRGCMICLRTHSSRLGMPGLILTSYGPKSRLFHYIKAASISERPGECCSRVIIQDSRDLLLQRREITVGPIAFATNSETLTSGKIAQLGGQQESKGGGWVNSSLRCYSLKECQNCGCCHPAHLCLYEQRFTIKSLIRPNFIRICLFTHALTHQTCIERRPFVGYHASSWLATVQTQHLRCLHLSSRFQTSTHDQIYKQRNTDCEKYSEQETTADRGM